MTDSQMLVIFRVVGSDPAMWFLIAGSDGQIEPALYSLELENKLSWSAHFYASWRNTLGEL